jgi:hypothetical protein
VRISGFSIVRDAVRLDFPIVPALRSLLPICDEIVVNVGRSDDETLDLVRSVDDPRVRVLETDWDLSRGGSVLRDETLRAMRACRHPWGMYIQADEVLHEAGAAALRATIEGSDPDPRVEGVVVAYHHIFASPDAEAVNRRWYRREVRAVRLDPALDVHPYRDAQGFRVGPADRRVRARLAPAEMFHYGYLRSARALRSRGAVDRALYPGARAAEGDPALLRWFPGIRPFRGTHPAVARDWVSAHAQDSDRRVARPRFEVGHLRLYVSSLVERWTGARLFEFRNYDLV